LKKLLLFASVLLLGTNFVRAADGKVAELGDILSSDSSSTSAVLYNCAMLGSFCRADTQYDLSEGRTGAISTKFNGIDYECNNLNLASDEVDLPDDYLVGIDWAR